MKRAVIWMTSALLWLLAVVPIAAAPWERWENLRRIADVGDPSGSWLYSSYCQDGCRFDRTSIDPGRGAQRFLRYDEVSDGVEAVAFEQFGPGALTRIWMTTGEGISQPLPAHVRIRIYIDGSDTPLIDVPLPRFFDGSTPGFDVPTTFDRLRNSGGNITYQPIPYRDGIRVSLLHGSEIRLWFQFNHIALSASSANQVDSWRAHERVAGLDELLESAGTSLWTNRYGYNHMGGIWTPPEDAEGSWLSGENRRLVLYEAKGSGWIDETLVHVQRTAWRRLRIVLTVDGQVTADVPLMDYFAVDPLAQVQNRSLLAGQDVGGGLFSRLPIPHRRHVKLEVVLPTASGSESVYVRHEVLTNATRPGPMTAPLHVRARSDCPTRLPDFTVFDHAGAGRMVGLVMYKTTDGIRAGAYYLEGDERLYIDGSTQPMWYGTGTEDLFGGGFYYDQGPFTLPLHGSPTKVGSGVAFTSTAYRWFLTDAPEWRRSIDFRLESGAWGTEPFCTRSVVFFYGRPTPNQQRVGAVDLADVGSIAAARYTVPAEAVCASGTGLWGDEPPTEDTLTVCRFDSGSTRFSLSLAHSYTNFRLRRTFDSAAAIQGGNQAAEVWVNGELAGHFGSVQPNLHRRWQQLDAWLSVPARTRELDIEIRPLNGGLADARYELFAAPSTRTQVGAVAPDPSTRPPGRP